MQQLQKDQAQIFLAHSQSLHFSDFSGVNTGILLSEANCFIGVAERFLPLPRCLSGAVTTATTSW